MTAQTTKKTTSTRRTQRPTAPLGRSAALNEPNARELSRGLPPAGVELMRMMARCRPAGSKSEAAWIATWIDSIPGVIEDHYGNRILNQGDSRVCWTSHTDTVHNVEGWQSLAIEGGVISLASTSKANCLGADCTTGAWIMRQLALAGVPGLYVWFRGEEIGCQGSRWIAEHHPAIFTGIKTAISLDRKGYNDIVTHQMGTRTASDAFARSLAQEIALHYVADDSGVYTDSNELEGIVGECTNISVGYHNQHSSSETQHITFALALVERLKRVNQLELTFDREPGEIDPEDHWSFGGRWTDYLSDTVNTESRATSDPYDTSGDYSRHESQWDELARMIQDNPHVIATLLDEYGFTADDIREAIYDATGFVKLARGA